MSPIKSVSTESILEGLSTAATKYKKEDLQDIPHIRIHDLAVIAKCQVGKDWMLTINDEIASHLGLDAETLLGMAIENNKKISPPMIMRIEDAINGAPPMDLLDGLQPVDIKGDGLIPMWVLSNKNITYGASFIADKDVLHRVSELMGGDMAILPSSIHELLIVPKDGDTNLQELRTMVKEVNQTVLEPEDYLSDNVYVYEHASQEVKLYNGQLEKEHIQARPQKPSGPRL